MSTLHMSVNSTTLRPKNSRISVVSRSKNNKIFEQQLGQQNRWDQSIGRGLLAKSGSLSRQMLQTIGWLIVDSWNMIRILGSKPRGVWMKGRFRPQKFIEFLISESFCVKRKLSTSREVSVYICNLDLWICHWHSRDLCLRDQFSEDVFKGMLIHMDTIAYLDIQRWTYNFDIQSSCCKWI